MNAINAILGALGNALGIAFDTISLLFEIAIHGNAEVARVVALVNNHGLTRTETYLRGFIRLAIVIAIFPIAILAFGLMRSEMWVVALAGTLWLIPTIFLSLVNAPLALLIEGLVNASRRRLRFPGKWYVNLVATIFLVEAAWTGYIMLVPISNNPGLVLPMVFVSLTLIVVVMKGCQGIPLEKIVGKTATLMFVAFTLSFFFPKSSAIVARVPGKLDDTIAPVIESILDTTSTGKQSEGYYPPCASSPDLYFRAGAPAQFSEVDIHPECWSGWITTPIGTSYSFQSTANLGLEVEFRDGHREYLEPSSNAWFGKRRGIFRLRGEGTVIVTFDYPDEEY